MKLIFKILLIVLFILIVIVLYAKSIVDKIEFDFNIKNLNFKEFILKDVTGQGSKTLITIEYLINNKSNTTIKIKDLYVEAYYNGKLIAKSTDKYDNTKEIVLNKKQPSKFEQEYYVLLNKQSIDLASKIALKTPVNIGYLIKVKLFGFSLKYKGTYNYK
jgi:hypothetical protein